LVCRPLVRVVPEQKLMKLEASLSKNQYAGLGYSPRMGHLRRRGRLALLSSSSTIGRTGSLNGVGRQTLGSGVVVVVGSVVVGSVVVGSVVVGSVVVGSVVVGSVVVLVLVLVCTVLVSSIPVLSGDERPGGASVEQVVEWAVHDGSLGHGTQAEKPHQQVLCQHLVVGRLSSLSSVSFPTARSPNPRELEI
jgi:hypothetical protein